MRKLLFLFVLACAACTTQAQDPGKQAALARAPAAQSGTAAPGDTLARLRAMVRDATCVESAQCRTVAVGAMACGGPESYLPYSIARSNEKAVRELGERYTNERLAQIKAEGMMSICRHIPDPGAVCTSGTCQLGGSSPAAR
ncbi:hypothetical protein [Massilia consociata]|uniref:Lipoprotein n=1 Tax=Massilia consociata TaxID=760117 RepID=A0ABV6FBH1_9BURK